MNYIVTNPQLRKFMIEYLDDFLNHCSVNDFDSYIVVDYNYPEPDEYSVDDVAMEYDSDDGRLFVNKDFFDKFTSWFPLDMEQSKSFIKDWFEDIYKVKIKYVES